MLAQLRNRIKATGPLTVADYMREALTHPQFGYYMKKEVFGRQGDFITSPEVSQTFGEVLGVWFYHYWIESRHKGPVNFIELGPGRGTLTADILRTMSCFDDVRDKLHIHLVEVSPFMRQKQWKLLCDQTSIARNLYSDVAKECEDKEDPKSLDDRILGVGNFTKHEVPISWHTSLADVPKGPSMILGHEFLDALPVHQFEMTDQGWREVLVDMNEQSNSSNNEPPLRFVLSRQPTPALAYLTDFHKESKRKRIEVCPQAGVIMEDVSNRITSTGGLGLFVDYGGEKPRSDFSLRAFQKHAVHDALRDPGNVDLTADVDFSYLRHVCQKQGAVECLGPVPQGYFLQSCGITHRVNKLLKSLDSAVKRKEMLDALEYMTSPHKMGMRFKMFSMIRQGSLAPPPFLMKEPISHDPV